MFDTITFPTKHESVTRHVHEHRSPTDESVRLLSEMEREVEAKVIAVNRLKDNVLDATWTVINDPMRLELRAVCRFKLNGKEFKFETELERPYRADARAIYKGICDRISAQLVQQMFMQDQQIQSLYLR